MFKTHFGYKQNYTMLKSFTLIELLISIVILWVGVLAIVQIAINYLGITDKVKLQTQATFLAKEWISLVNFLKTSNKKRSSQRNCFKLNTNYECTDYLQEWKAYQISYNPLDNKGNLWENVVVIQPTTLAFDDNRLFLHSWHVNWYSIFWYNYLSTDWKATNFARYLSTEKIFSEPDWTYLPIDKIIKVSSIVKYKKWAISGQVILETFISKY